MKNSKKTYHIGCSGFYNVDWKGSLYPKESQNKDFLKLYSKVYNTVEINSTFYRKPTSKTLQKWIHETPDNFKFFIKIPKTISHSSLCAGDGRHVCEITIFRKNAGFCGAYFHASGAFLRRLVF